MKRRLFSLLLCGAMLLSMCPTGLAAEPEDGGLCPHHQEHSFEDCGYTEAVEGQPCGYVCSVCPVQALIDALPDAEDITADNRDEVEAQLEAIDTARMELTGEEDGQLVGSRYQDVVAALSALDGQAGADIPVLAAKNVEYLYCDINRQKWETKFAAAYSVTDSSDWNNDKGGWYVVDNGTPATIDGRITVTGDVSLILADGYSLTVNGGINVSEGNSLTIYGQQNGTGALIAEKPGDYNAGIGGNRAQSGGSITINGGNITVNGGTESVGNNIYGAGIGGGEYGTGGNITINGGTVTTIGGYRGAGIGGGRGAEGGNITINGGIVTATTNGQGAGIGGGGCDDGNNEGGAGGSITINGGTVTATGAGDWGGAGIGGGRRAAGGSITITGGTVTARGAVEGAGIGGGWGRDGGNITISGGIVTAIGGQDSPGIGGGAGGSEGTFSTGENGSALIFASSIQNNGYQNDQGTSGIIFAGNDGRVYGNPRVQADIEISSNRNLTVPNGSTLTIDSGVKLTNSGNIINHGGIINNGALDNSGTITGNGTITGSGSYSGSKITPNVRVTAAQSLIYNGAAQDLITGSTNGGTLQYSTDNSTWSTGIPTGTNAGNYTVHYRVEGNTYYNDVTGQDVSISIGKATPSVTAPTAVSGLTYTGAAQNLISAGGTTGGTLQYSTDNSTWNTGIPTGTNAGSYTVYYRVLGGNNYNDVAAQRVSVTIGKAPAPASVTKPLNIANSLAKTYNFAFSNLRPEVSGSWVNVSYEIAVNFTAAGYYNNDAAIVAGPGGIQNTLSLPILFNEVTTTGQVGTVTVTVKSDNYEDYTGYIEIIASNKTAVTFSGVEGEETPYTGQPVTGYRGELEIADNEGNPVALTPEISYTGRLATSYESTQPPTQAGTYFVVFRVADTDENYIGRQSFAFEITKASRDITVTGQANGPTQITLDDAVITPSDTGGTVSYGINTANTVPTDWQTDKVFSGLTAGTTYYFFAKVEASENYTAAVSEGVAISTPAKAVSGIMITGQPTTLNYTSGQTLDLSGLSVTVSYNDSTSETIAWSEGRLTADPAEGTTLTVAGYNGKTVAISCGGKTATTNALTVIQGTQTDLSITGAPATIYSGDSFTLTLSGGSGTGAVAWEIVSGPATVDASGKVTVTGTGEIQIKAVKAADTDYTQAEATITLNAVTRPTPPPAKYLVTVNGGSGGGSYAAGDTVTITATIPSGQRFTGWTVNAGGVTLADVSSATTTFTMPAQAVTVTANFQSNSGGGSSDGGGGGSYTPPTYKPDVSKPSGGGGEAPTVSPSNPKQGDTVTVTPKPDRGYEVDKITVTDRNGKPVEVTKKPDGTYTFKQPSGRVTIEIEYAPVPLTDLPWNNPFADVSEGDWYYDAVRFVHERGLMNGYSDGRFGPNDTLSRAQLAQILFNKEGRPVVNYLMDFSDVAGEAWYAEAVRWATSQGIVGGYGDGTFGPNDPITREQLAVMLWRYSGSPAATNKELHFNDTDEISPFALEAMRWAVENGILNGYGDGRLGPQGQATRAQVAQMLKNFIENQESK